jgi:hypothetical protein
VAERECCKTGNDALRVHRALRLESLEQRLRRWGLGNGRAPASSVAIGLFVQGSDSTSQSIRRPSVRCRTGNRIGRPSDDSRSCRVVVQAGPPATPIRRARRPGENLTQQLGVSNIQRDDPHENVQPVGVTGRSYPAICAPPDARKRAAAASRQYGAHSRAQSCRSRTGRSSAEAVDYRAGTGPLTSGIGSLVLMNSPGGRAFSVMRTSSNKPRRGRGPSEAY